MILSFALGCLVGALAGLAALAELNGFLLAFHATYRDPRSGRFVSYRDHPPGA